jgi:hypothetical protein
MPADRRNPNLNGHGLRWLAIQLAGDTSWNAVTLAGEAGMGPRADPIFENWVAAWLRKLILARVLQTVSGELRASALHVGQRRLERLTAEHRAAVANADRVQLERALSALDLFPRCALLLTFFEDLAIEDVGILLNADKDLVARAAAIAMKELVQTLPARPDWDAAPFGVPRFFRYFRETTRRAYRAARTIGIPADLRITEQTTLRSSEW